MGQIRLQLISSPRVLYHMLSSRFILIIEGRSTIYEGLKTHLLPIVCYVMQRLINYYIGYYLTSRGQLFSLEQHQKSLSSVVAFNTGSNYRECRLAVKNSRIILTHSIPLMHCSKLLHESTVMFAVKPSSIPFQLHLHWNKPLVLLFALAYLHFLHVS